MDRWIEKWTVGWTGKKIDGLMDGQNKIDGLK